MTEIKPAKLLPAILLGLSAFFFALSLAGVIAVWVINLRLTHNITLEMARVQADLTETRDQIDASQAELESLQSQIDVFQAFLDTLGKDAVENTRLLAEVVARVEGNISPVLDDLSAGVERVREGFESVKKTIARLNNLPLVSIHLPGEPTLEAIASGLADLQGQIGETKARVESISQVTQDTVAALTSGFETWEDYIALNQQRLEEYEAEIEGYQARLSYLSEKLPVWIDWGSVVLTVLLVWLAASQVGVFILAWSFYKGEDLLARWRSDGDA